MSKLPVNFYSRDAVDVAQTLLGKIFVHSSGKTFYSGIITEVEAYNQEDEASHSYKGVSERNKVMFYEGGHLYVYFIYGAYNCMNVVTSTSGVGEAVLIRGIEPITGIKQMLRNRGINAGRIMSALSNLTNGPGKVCEAFAISKKHNGLSLTEDIVYICSSSLFDRKFSIGSSARIGITKGTHLQWRFFIKGNSFVSKYK